MAGTIPFSPPAVIQTGISNTEDSMIEPGPTLIARQALGFLAGMGISPSALKFDSKSGQYFNTGGSKFRKVRNLTFALMGLCKTVGAKANGGIQTLCFLLLALTWTKISIASYVTPPEDNPSKTGVILYRLLSCSYFAFITSFCWTLFLKFDVLVQILNDMAKLMGGIRHRNGSATQRKVS